MKFRFCGDLDAPDWLLKEIALLSKISAVKIRLLVVQIINEFLGIPIDYEKVGKLTKEASLDNSDVKACIAALDFIISSGVKYDIDDNTLSNELQQLGMPKEHCDALSKPFCDSKQKIKMRLEQQTLKLSRLLSLDWRIDYLMSSSLLHEVNSPVVQFKLSMGSADRSESRSFEMTADKVRVLLNELKAAKEIMDSIR